jgi:uncharacterized protein YbaA (DUF1428 family)
MEEVGRSMPFDGKRMVFGGFAPFVDVGNSGGTPSAPPAASLRTGYVDGFVLPVPEAKREAYHTMANRAWENFGRHGALRLVEAWGDDVPDGEVTDFRRSVAAEPGEGVVFSWIEWPSKQARDKAWRKMMEDPAMQPDGEMPFDGRRMFWGGFETILDERKG